MKGPTLQSLLNGTYSDIVMMVPVRVVIHMILILEDVLDSVPPLLHRFGFRSTHWQSYYDVGRSFKPNVPAGLDYHYAYTEPKCVHPHHLYAINFYDVRVRIRSPKNVLFDHHYTFVDLGSLRCGCRTSVCWAWQERRMLLVG